MEWGILLALVTLIFVLLTVWMLPKRFLRYERKSDSPRDLGTKKFDMNGDRSFIFEPTPDAKKYIKKYAVVCDDDGAKLIVKPDASVYRICYDVLCFDHKGNLLERLNVEESFAGEYGAHTKLPSGTAAVEIVVKSANGIAIQTDDAVSLKKSNVVWYLILFALLAFGECVCFNYCLGKLLGGLFGEAFALSWEGFTIAAVESLVVSLICAVLIKSFYGNKSRKRKKSQGGRK